MPLTPGTRLGIYEITAPLGEGGMGQVWRATDTTLGRQVAIKILPDAFAADPERLARFEREAKTLASLNHPHIAAIYAVEKSGGTLALVMELVEGDDLSQRIKKGAIPIDEALPIAKQIAEALEAAHEQGIIHRDLKPANIKVRPDGTVKVLDFGLAKAMDPPAGSSPHVSQSPTITSPAMTQAGMILGTAAYMAPEQARGKVVDKRADIWAFGAVLFEMLTGTRAFPGEDLTDTLAAVVRAEPNWTLLPAGLPSALGVFLKRCLQKDPKQRIPDIAAMRLALDGAFDSAVPHPTQTLAQSPRGRLPWVIATAAVVGVAALAVPAVRYLQHTPPPETRTEIVTPTAGVREAAWFALSPDGRQIVFAASGDGASRLWVRSLATTTAQPLAGTEGGGRPFWSPDGRSVGFFARGALKRLDVVAGGGGTPQTLASIADLGTGTWNAEGVILFGGLNRPLMRVSASGGTVTAVTTLEPQQSTHFAPFFLPDGRRFLFGVSGAPDVTGIYLGSLDGSPSTRLTPDYSVPTYLAAGPGTGSGEDGWLLWGRAGTLLAQRLDVDRQTLVGAPRTVADGMLDVAPFPAVGWSVAAPGLVAYRVAASRQRRLTWVDRSGTSQVNLGDPDPRLDNPRVSPDGRRVVVGLNRSDQIADLWLLDGTRMSRLTFDAAADMYPLWSPDGTRIVFRSTRTGNGELYRTLANGAGRDERVVASAQALAPTGWSPDGRYLLYMAISTGGDADLWVAPMAGDATPSVFLKTPFNEAWAAFSPDGRWVAYHSNASGRHEVYVRPFVPPTPEASADKPGASGTPPAAASGQWQVSTAGGIHPVWGRDGNELFYVNPAGAMMAAPITVVGNRLEPGDPRVLFATGIVGVSIEVGRQYDVAPDGRFLINVETTGDAAPITLIQHWNPEAKQ